MSKTIYLDHAATTQLNPQVLEVMMPYLTNLYGNASSIYTIGRESRKAIEESRLKVAEALNAKPKEIYFTNSGTESDNWAIKGVAYANKDKGKHIITSSIEHHAVLHTCKYLERQEFEVTYLPVDDKGFVSIESVKNAIREDTILISIMFANNEIGTVQPIREIGKVAREKGIIFHTDAVQAVGNIPIDVEELNIDLLSLSGHKINGPKGIGVLYIRDGIRIDNLLHGGAQERGKRPSTENVAGIVGLGEAIKLATSDIDKKSKKLEEMRDRTIAGLIEKIPYTRVNGDLEKRLPGNVNVCFEYIEGESILLMLDMQGIYASSGSACTSGSLDPSHVLLAIGLPHEIAHGSLRLTFGEENTIEDVDHILEVLPPIIEKLRGMSPLFEKRKQNGTI